MQIYSVLLYQLPDKVTYPMPLSFELSQGSKLRLYVDLTFDDTSLVLLGPIFDFPFDGLPTRLVGFIFTDGMAQRVIFESPGTKNVTFISIHKNLS